MRPYWIRVSESALQSQSQPLSQSYQASQVWSKPPRGHYLKPNVKGPFLWSRLPGSSRVVPHWSRRGHRLVQRRSRPEGCIYSDRWPHQRFSPSRLVCPRWAMGLVWPDNVHEQVSRPMNGPDPHRGRGSEQVERTRRKDLVTGPTQSWSRPRSEVFVSYRSRRRVGGLSPCQLRDGRITSISRSDCVHSPYATLSMVILMSRSGTRINAPSGASIMYVCASSSR